jgi:hypothetical protein
MVDEFAGHFAPNDLNKARAAWKQSLAMDRVDSALKTKAVFQPTPANLRPEGAPDPGVLNGKAFSKTILDLKTKGTLQAAGLTPEHIQALQDLGTLLENGANVHRLGKLVAGGGALAEAIGLVTHPVAAGTAAAAAVPAYAMSRLLGRVMTDQKAAAMAVKALQAGQRIVPAIGSQAPRSVFDGAKDSLVQQ